MSINTFARRRISILTWMVLLLIVQPFAIAVEHINDLSDRHAGTPHQTKEQQAQQARHHVISTEYMMRYADQTNGTHSSSPSTIADPNHCGDDDSCTSGDCCHIAIMATLLHFPKQSHVFNETTLAVSDEVIPTLIDPPPSH